MAQNGCSAIFRIQKFIHEHMNCGAKGVQSKVADVFREGEKSERHAE
jgi:hypothetical protein